jgi:hypothetical protein
LSPLPSPSASTVHILFIALFYCSFTVRPRINSAGAHPLVDFIGHALIAQSWREPVPIGGRPFSLLASHAMMVTRAAGRGGCCGGVGCGNSAQAFAATGAGGGSSWIIIRRASKADGSSRSGFGSLWSHSLRPDCGSYVSSPHHGVQFSVSAADRSTVSFSLFFLFFWVSWKHGGEIKGRDIQEGNKHIFWRLFFCFVVL